MKIKFKLNLRRIFNTLNGLLILTVNRLKINPNNITIFCYHDVTNMPSEFCEKYNLFVNIENFNKQINFIKSNFNIINPKHLDEQDFKIPQNAAIITFDDGFKGTFDNALPYLEKNKIPSVVFLNMDTIVKKNPMVSAVAKYVEDNKIKFQELDIKNNYHNYIKYSDYLSLICKEHLILLISKYQGYLANDIDLLHFNNSKYVSFANHYYQHFDSRILTNDEIIFQIIENEKELLKYNNYLSLFAFTNGSFTMSNIELIKTLRIFKRLFTSSGSVSNNNSYILDRIAIDNSYGNKFSMIALLNKAHR